MEIYILKIGTGEKYAQKWAPEMHVVPSTLSYSHNFLYFKKIILYFRFAGINLYACIHSPFWKICLNFW
jgi:hypothetical protein